MKKIHIVILIVSFVLILPVIASISSANQVQETAESNTPIDDKKSKQDEDFQVFKPKEEISEDLSVPFPVDI